MLRKSKEIYEFSQFRLDVSERLLLREGKPVSLPEKAFETLCVLVRNHQKLVSKDELMREVWTDLIVEENNLDQKISILRQTLGENGRSKKKFIETVRGRGYRFVAEVKQLETIEPVAVDKFSKNDSSVNKDSAPVKRTAIKRAGNVLRLAEWQTENHEAEKSISEPFVNSPIEKTTEKITNQNVETQKETVSTKQFFWQNQRLSAVILAAFLTIGAILFVSFSPRRLAPTTAPASIKSIAVLPFKPIVAADSDDSFELGLTDALISQLSGSPQLAVRPLSSVRRYAKIEQDATVAGQSLRADVVLDGNYQRAGERVRVSLRLVQTTDGQILWADKFDEKKIDAFALQDEISARVAKALLPRLTNSETYALNKRGTNDAEAFALYQRGRYFWNQRTESGYRKAIECFEQAIDRDADFAQSYSGLADAYMLLGGYQIASHTQADFIAQARRAALRALEIDSRLAEPHASLGLIAFNYDWDFAAAEQHYRRAIELNPNYVTAHHWYGAAFLFQMKRFDEAVAEMRRAQELDPLSSIINTDLGQTYYFARRYEEAITQLRYTLELNPNFDLAHKWLAMSYVEKGDYKAALDEIKQTSPDFAVQSKFLTALTKARAGEFDEARALVTDLEQRADAQVQQNNAVHFAIAYAALSDKDKALMWLEKEYRARGTGMTSLAAAPFYDPLRGDSRFENLIKRVGFPSTNGASQTN